MRHRYGDTLGVCFAAVALFAIGIAMPTRAAAPEVTITPAGPSQTVFDWSKDACETWDIPDAPARAFRDASGTVHLIAAHFINRASTGLDFDSLKRDCRVLFEGGGRDAPQEFDDQAWLSGFFTEDGTTVYALVHNEYQGNRRPALCPSGLYIRCWRNAITFAVSHDGGRTFSQPKPPANLVATLPYPYEGNLGRHVGYFAPTNIVKKDGAYFAMFSTTEYKAQAWGVCIMRTERIDDPSSWRAWDGKAFTVRFSNPYKDEISDPARHVCAPVGRGKLITPLGGIVRHEPSGAYLLVMAGTRRSVSGIYAAASWNLIDWSEPSLVWRVPTRPLRDGCTKETYDYPALLDAAGKDRNYATVGETADLYLVRQNFQNCRTGPDRDLLRRAVRIEVKPIRP